MLSLRQALTPPSLMGRMNAAFRTLLFGGGALGGLLGGYFAGVVGIHQALIVAAIASASMLIPLAVSPVSRIRDLPNLPNEPSPETPITAGRKTYRSST